MTEEQKEGYYYLCYVCGSITPFSEWVLWKYAEDGETEIVTGDGDDHNRCPVCKWDHLDNDSGPGIMDGDYETLCHLRDAERAEWGEGWREKAQELLEASQESAQESAGAGTEGTGAYLIPEGWADALDPDGSIRRQMAAEPRPPEPTPERIWVRRSEDWDNEYEISSVADPEGLAAVEPGVWTEYVRRDAALPLGDLKQRIKNIMNEENDRG